MAGKLVLPENVLVTLLNDRLVAKGTVLDFITTFFQVYLAKEPLDDLKAVLAKARLSNRLEELMPPGKRGAADFAAHFGAAGLAPLVEWNMQRQVEEHLAELRDDLQRAIEDDPPLPPADILALVKARKTEHGLPDAEVVRVIWGCLMRSVNMTGKNQGQILQGIMRAIKTHRKLLAAFVVNGRLELTLLVAAQVACYEDNRLLKLFADVVKALYSSDLVGEDAVQHWHKKGSHPKGRNVFLKDLEPFIRWLDEASEEEEGEEGDE